MTKRHKIVMKPNEINLDENIINSFGEDESFITVEVEDGKIKVVNNNEEI
jgi:predicted Fe-Mo cluster-binding NifX family protein